MAVSFHDGSRLPWWLARGAVLSVSASLEGRGGAIEVPRPSLVPGDTAVWHLKLDLYKLLSQYHVSSYRPIYGTFIEFRSLSILDSFRYNRFGSKFTYECTLDRPM